MKTKRDWPVGVCSWSLGPDIGKLASCLRQLRVRHVHLAVGGITKAQLGPAKSPAWTITCAMVNFPQEDYSTLESIRRTGGIVPDRSWPANRRRFIKACNVAKHLRTPFISMHAGFLDHGNKAGAGKFYRRMRDLADIALKRGLTLLMETGQETAADMRKFLVDMDHPALGINFDPANMILYGKGNPVKAVKTLGPWIRHAHIKDAKKSKKRGEWGEEVPWGKGEVDGKAFLRGLRAAGFKGALAVEREAGNNRMGDIKSALSILEKS